MSELALCRQCVHYRETAVFNLCTHPSSYYVVAEREDFHTIGHMRQHACNGGVNFVKKAEQR
jgi:recombinational DNA repair protein RecR